MTVNICASSRSLFGQLPLNKAHENSSGRINQHSYFTFLVFISSVDIETTLSATPNYWRVWLGYGKQLLSPVSYWFSQKLPFRYQLCTEAWWHLVGYPNNVFLNFSQFIRIHFYWCIDCSVTHLLIDCQLKILLK